MIEKVEGIIVSETPFKESSKILNVYTKEHGTIGIIAKGAKKLKSKLRGVTNKLTYGYFHIYYKENKLCDLISVDIIDNFDYIKSDIVLIGYMSYLTELTSSVFKQSNELDLYKLLLSGIKKINEKYDPKVITNIIEIKYLDYLGISLNLDSCIKCNNTNNIVTIDPDEGGFICKDCYTDEKIYDPKVIKLLRMYYYVDINSITELKISDEIKNDIGKILDLYYDRYAGMYLKSKEFLNKIIN